jgi:hypothetical protein
MSASSFNDDAGENWRLVQIYSPDLAKRIEKAFRQSDDKSTRKACVQFIRDCGYTSGVIGHASAKPGSALQPKTVTALKDISNKLSQKGY